MVDEPLYDDDFFEVDDSDEPYDYDAIEEAEANPPDRAHLQIEADRPVFEALFTDAVAGDPILESFATHVVGRLSLHFANKAAKGGAFFAARDEEGLDHAYRFQHDQNLRAHLINGMLPVVRIARQLVKWDAAYFDDWEQDIHERILIAGYVLHDYLKIEEVKRALAGGMFDGIQFVPNEAPSKEQMPTLVEIFRRWTHNLGLDAFLQPIGGAEPYLEDLIYIACNTQGLKGTARSLSLYQKLELDIDMLDLITYLSRLADLIAYVAKTPRDVVAHETIKRLIVIDLSFDNQVDQPIARFTYHHLAENRGLLLNFIHDAVTKSISDETRIPLLFAPSGVVYLEHAAAVPITDIDLIIDKTITNIRQAIGVKMLKTGVGSQLNKDGLRVGETFRDVFDLQDIVANSHTLLDQIRSNVPKYIEYLEESDWPYTDNLPSYSTDKTDVRIRQMAEWASLIDTQFEERFPDAVDSAINFIFDAWRLDEELRKQFEVLRDYNQRGVGIRHRWYWAALYALAVKEGQKGPEAIREWLAEISMQFAEQLPTFTDNGKLPEIAFANQETWEQLRHYIKHVLSIQSTKSNIITEMDEFANYVDAKVTRGASTCAICGSAYTTRDQLASAVAFQPGVYTQRVRIGASNNKRSMCTICATEQLLRQLFIQTDNLPTGKDLEAQNVRYLSFYPAYFFSPETLKMIKRVYSRLEQIRMSDGKFQKALRRQHDLADTHFWQYLDQFWLNPNGRTDDENQFDKVLRYDYGSQTFTTFFTAGFRAGFRDITETESWVMPTLLAFVMAINLDVKVVGSDNDIPLMLEATELPETLWFDGLHPSIQQLIAVRVHENKHTSLEPRTRMDVDSMSLALARLTAAYLIHLDSEYEPPKENWQRFSPIANALCESPLYVFHYLKKQERDDRPLTRSRIKRYIAYAEGLFNIQGDENMTHASELVRLYRGFYRAKTVKNANSILRPLSVVSDALLVADQSVFDSSEALYEIAYGELSRFMDRVGSGQADGRFPKGISAAERQVAVRDFVDYFVNKVFVKGFNSDVAALRGKQLNLLKSACEVLYRDAQYEEWAANNETEELDETE